MTPTYQTHDLTGAPAAHSAPELDAPPMPHHKLLGSGFSTPGPLFCLICTIFSNKTGLFDSYQNTPQVLAARSLLVARFDTRWVPRRVSCGWIHPICVYAFGLLWWPCVMRNDSHM